MTILTSDRDAGRFTFRFEQAERDWLRHILALYPVQQTPLKAINEDAATNALLDQALAKRREKLREDTELFLKAGKLEIDASFNEYWDLTLTAVEVEELLQILNNVRVGLWIQLGKPAPSIEQLLPTHPSEDKVRAHMIMHVCAAWQAALMAAVDPESPPEASPDAASA